MAIGRWLGTISALMLTGAITLDGAAAQSASKIGIASAVQNQVEGSIAGRTRPLSTGSDVFAREVVRTGEAATAQLLFLDETSLTIGPLSDVTLDRFVFDPQRGAGSMAINLGRGALRFATGSQRPSSYQIRTPVATIGVRGTLFDVRSAVSAAGQPVLIAILVEGVLIIQYDGQEFVLDVPGKAWIFSPPRPPQLVTWDSSIFHASADGPSLPLFGYSFLGDPRRIETPDSPMDRLDQLFGAGGPPAPPPPNDCNYQFSCND